MVTRSDPLYGLRPKTLAKLEKRHPQVPWRPLLHWLSTNDSMAAVVKSKVFDDAGFPKTQSTAQGRIDAALIAACEVLEPVFVKALYGPDNEAEQKVMLKLFGRRVRGSLDSAPIYCTRSQVGQYNSHYGGLIRKMIVFARHDGQIELITKTFDGNKYDNHLLDECSDKGEIERMLEARTYFGDLHFRRPGVINHAGRLSLAAAEEGKARENLAKHSERQGFIRARVEHCFCASRMRRFKRISPWRGTTVQYLDLAVRCIAAVLNFEIQETYKNQCFYTKPLTYSRICEKTHGFKVTKHRFNDLFKDGKQAEVKRNKLRKKAIDEGTLKAERREQRQAARQKREKAREERRAEEMVTQTRFGEGDDWPTPVKQKYRLLTMFGTGHVVTVSKRLKQCPNITSEANFDPYQRNAKGVQEYKLFAWPDVAWIKTGEKLPDPMCFQSGVGEGAAVAAQPGGEAAAADDDDNDSASRESATTSGDDESSVSDLDYESEGSNFTAHSHHGKAAKKKHRTEGDAPRNK